MTTLDEKLKKAVEAFNNLTPAQKAEMLEEQRQSFVRGNIGLSRDDRGITTPVIASSATSNQALKILLSDQALKDISTEFLSWKGKNPYQAARGGYRAWEIEKPAIKAALRFVIRAISDGRFETLPASPEVSA